MNKNPGIAAVLSFFLPGLGQIYSLKIARGISLLVVWVTWNIVNWSLFASTQNPGAFALGLVAAVGWWIWNIFDARNQCYEDVGEEDTEL